MPLAPGVVRSVPSSELEEPNFRLSFMTSTLSLLKLTNFCLNHKTHNIQYDYGNFTDFWQRITYGQSPEVSAVWVEYDCQGRVVLNMTVVDSGWQFSPNTISYAIRRGSKPVLSTVLRKSVKYFIKKYICNDKKKNSFQVKMWPIFSLNDSETQERWL